MTLTNDDKLYINTLLDSKLEEQKEEIVEEFKNFRSDFYEKIDPVLKEVAASREERVIRAEQHKRNEERIERLEKLHPHNKHSLSV